MVHIDGGDARNADARWLDHVDDVDANAGADVGRREELAHGLALPAVSGTAWRYGLYLGFQCMKCCAGLMGILLVTGIMDLKAMGFVTAAITIERLAPRGERIARALGVVVIGVGLFLIARAAGLG